MNVQKSWIDPISLARLRQAHMNYCYLMEAFVDEEDRLRCLLVLRQETDATLDALYALTEDLDSQALRRAIGRVSALPKYRKSKLRPYASHISIAPLRDSLDDPVSQFE